MSVLPGSPHEPGNAAAEVATLRRQVDILFVALRDSECFCQPTRDHVEGLYGEEPHVCERCSALEAFREAVSA